MDCRKQYSWCSLRGKLAEVAVYSLVRSRFCRNKHSSADYCGNLLGSRAIGAGSFPIGCEGFVKASKVQGSSLLLSIADNFVGYSYIYIYIRLTVKTDYTSLCWHDMNHDESFFNDPR